MIDAHAILDEVRYIINAAEASGVATGIGDTAGATRMKNAAEQGRRRVADLLDAATTAGGIDLGAARREAADLRDLLDQAQSRLSHLNAWLDTSGTPAPDTDGGDS